MPASKKTWRLVIRRIAVTCGVLVSLAVLGGLTYVAWLLPGLPDVAYLHQVREARPSVVLAGDGTVLTEFRRDRREAMPLERISPHVVQALLATEDQRFYRHRGVDWRRTALALLHTAGGTDQGGSTLTQQLARNLFPEDIGRTRSIHRKAREMLTALKIEQAASKREILETYLNTVPFLYNTYGIEMAAHTYFNKPAAQLDLAESATLVGMLKGTQYYNPVRQPERALRRRNVVLAQMLRQEQLTQSEFEAASAQPLGAALHRPPAPAPIAPHFTAHVRKWLAAWAEREGHDLYAEGLVVHTTLDPRLQALAEQAVSRQALALQKIVDVEWSSPRMRASLHAGFYARLHAQVTPFSHLWHSRPDLVDAFMRESSAYREAAGKGLGADDVLARLKADRAFMQQLLADKSRLEAGFVAMDPASGAVRAWVGSRDFGIDQFDHVAQAVRQPGSTFKPFVYGAALQQGISQNRTYPGGPVSIRLADGRIWSPTDMDMATTPLSLREGLVQSKNSITAQIMQEIGIDPVVELAQSMGVRQSRLDPVISIGLGTSPVTLLEMVSAYASIARIGEYRAPLVVTRILSRDGAVLAEFGDEAGEPVLAPQVAIELIDMLREAADRGTGRMIKQQFGIAADVAGKTGTTQNNTDGWFILMHPQLVVGAWIGFNDQRVTMRSNYWGQGGHNAVMVVGDFFRDALRQRQVDARVQFPRPPRPRVLTVERENVDDTGTGEVSVGAGGNDAGTSGSGEDEGGDDNDEGSRGGTAIEGEAATDVRAAGLRLDRGILVRRIGQRVFVGDARGMQAMERDAGLSADGGQFPAATHP